MIDAEYISLLDEHRNNHEWFEKHYEALVKKYNGEHVAIHYQRVIDHDRELRALMKRVRKKFPGEEFFVHFVTTEKIELILWFE
ncbi:MAG: DUF5678 domain-containing protein [Thermodesulfobacteriota bacterium]